MTSVTQIKLLLDMAVFLLPVAAGALTSRWQPSGGEEPSERIRQGAWACVAVIGLFIVLHMAMLGKMLPRVPLAAFYMPLGFVMGYVSHSVLLTDRRPDEREGRLLAGLSVAAVIVIGLWQLVRTLVTVLM